MIIWMYYETDGDSGYYNIHLFTTEAKALTWKRQANSPYGHVEQFKVK